MLDAGCNCLPAAVTAAAVATVRERNLFFTHISALDGTREILLHIGPVTSNIVDVSRNNIPNHLIRNGKV